MFRDKSYQFKLLALTGGVIFSLCAIFSVVLAVSMKESEKTVMAEMANIAGTAGDGIAALFFERYGDVQAFAVNPTVVHGKPEEITEALNIYTAMYGIYDIILVTDTAGRVVAVNDKDPNGKPINSKILLGRSVASQEWFRNSITGKFTEDKEKNLIGTYVEDVQIDAYVSEVYGGSRFGSSFSAPIKDKNGQVVGVISNRANSKWYEFALQSTYDVISEGGFGHPHVVMLNSKGEVAAEILPNAAGKSEPSHDMNRLLKTNFVSANFSAAMELKKSWKNGYTRGRSPDGGKDVGAGYAPVDGPKMVESVGWGVVVYGSLDEILAEEYHLQYWAYGALVVLLMIAMAVTYYFARAQSKVLRKIAVNLGRESGDVNKMAGVLSTNSESLSSSTSQQAAALQETVASIDEVSAMTQKNAENAKRSRDVASQSSEAAERGKKAVADMNHAIDAIQKSNANVMAQVEAGNQKLSEIVKVINEIGTKTKVINDIVFQTKLLSFNASVEAARAGEHGKGFAVVAEEVGNLAQMSGNAAKDISQLLDTSVQQVEKIVAESRGNVERLMADSRDRLKEGTETAKSCGAILEEVVSKAGEVTGLVAEIATASDEQSRGVQEINKAMNQLDQVTQANSASAREASGLSSRLSEQSSRLSDAVGLLNTLVEGVNGAPSAAAPRNSAVSKVIPFPSRSSDTAELKRTGTDGGNAKVPSRDDNRFEEV